MKNLTCQTRKTIILSKNYVKNFEAKRGKYMTERKEVITYCSTFPNTYEDYPFCDPNWCVMRHKKNRKVFAWIFEKDGCIWVNVKCDPQWRQFWRETYASVVPAYHLNKEHWNSLILDGTIPQADICRMIQESYDLTMGKKEHKMR